MLMELLDGGWRALQNCSPFTKLRPKVLAAGSAK
jgi:hypothetical protein